MLRNYFLAAWRGLVRNRVYSTINVAGLAAGMAVVVLISLWMLDELNYNKAFVHYDRIVKVLVNQQHGNDIRTVDHTPIPLAADLQTRYAADFSRVALTSYNFSHILTLGDKQLNKNGLYVQPEMMDILDLRLTDGRKAVLDDPSSILISQSTAKALYGDQEAVGKNLRFDDRVNFKVAGVFSDMPDNSDFRGVNYFAPWADYVASVPSVKNSVAAWNINSYQLFALLQDQADLGKLGAKVRGELNGHGRTDKPAVLLQPMSRWHLYADFKDGKNVGGTIQFVWMFGIIGAFVLLLACINFMNLSTARSERRAKEVGVRKSVGSLRRQLVVQFLGESVLLALLAFAVSLLVVQLLLPWFNTVADKQLLILWNSPRFWALTLGGTLLAGMIAGSYPAFYLSGFKPAKVLKGTFRAGRWAALPRQALIVVQFTVSVALIIGTIVVFQQIIFVKNRPVGYTRKGLISVDVINQVLTQHYDVIRQELIRSGAAVDVAGSSSPTTAVYANQSGFSWETKDPNMSPTFAVIHCSYDFGATVSWLFVAGRDFSRDFLSDSAAMVVNETAVKYMGLKDAAGAIGATVKYLYSPRADQNYHIIGVIRDMVMESPFTPAKQSIFMIDDQNQPNVITVRLNPKMAEARALPVIGSIFRKYNPGSPFQFTYNDEVYAQKFKLEDRIGKIAGFFTILAIFISCLGLWGLASFMAEQRVKEIGVRKVLGASVFRLWGLLSRDFVVLVGISFLLAAPLAWNLMQRWLLQYQYRVTIAGWVFIVTMGVALFITLLTVSWQAVRTARANPVRSLRME